ncbi:prolyl oligopeptidase family serine peptidase [Caldifermentibacillus hisashii]|uniref:prolyl oligopeptidase family serine peptidase n=1 Tax=Caldifermentibacillus hisashii TaxID=996558 RepID=UPI0031B681A7
MIIVDKKIVANIPLLEVVQKELLDQAVPTVFFFHGFTSAKEHNLHYAYLIAEKNIRVVLPEADLHGERSRELSMEEQALYFWKIILKNIAELAELKEAYVGNRRTLQNQIGVAGTSMGGITTFGALCKYNWIKAAVSLMGNPAYNHFARYLVNELQSQGHKIPYSEQQLEGEYQKLLPVDLSLNPEKLNNRPLLFWHGKKDPIVPYTYAYDFYQKVKENYSEHPDHIRFILDQHAGHKVSREGLLATVEWFEQFLK